MLALIVLFALVAMASAFLPSRMATQVRVANKLVFIYF